MVRVEELKELKRRNGYTDKKMEEMIGYKRILFTGGRDWHGLHLADNSLWATDPVQDVITELDFDGNLLGVYDWKDEKVGRLHTNDIFIDHDDLYTCCFNWGICKNGIMLERGKKTQPHSVIRWCNELYYCASNKGDVEKDGKLFAHVGGFTRGLHATPQGLYVGSSKKRHNAGGTGGTITLLDWSGKKLWHLDLPTNEVYGITSTAIGANS